MVIYLSDTTEDQVHAAADELQSNQGIIMYRTAIRFPSRQADRLLFCDVIQIQYDL